MYYRIADLLTSIKLAGKNQCYNYGTLSSYDENPFHGSGTNLNLPRVLLINCYENANFLSSSWQTHIKGFNLLYNSLIITNNQQVIISTYFD